MKANIARYEVVVVVVVVFAALRDAQDPCTDYKDIGNPRRSPAFILPQGQVPICDTGTITPGEWYRFVQYTGEKMPEFCPEHRACGTLSPIWVNGTHPTVVGVEEDAVCCMHDSGDCCHHSRPMKMLLCDVGIIEYYVYQLPEVTACPAGFCAGDLEPCDEDSEWNEHRQECVTPTRVPTTSAVTTAPDTSSWQTPTPTFPAEDETPGANIGLIIGVCLGCAAVGALVGVLVFYCLKKGKPNKVSETPPPTYSATDEKLPTW